MTTDTSREAVEALIARARDAEKYDLLQTFFPQAKPSDRLGTVMVDTLAALLDERDRLAANRDAWVSDAMTSTTELEQRIHDLEAERDGLEDSLSARDVELQQRALRIRDLEFQNESLAGQVHHLESVRDDVRIALLQRAERAEAELLHARGISEIREAERDRLKSRADNSLRAVRDVAAKLDAVKAIVRGSYVISGECRDKLRAILADTTEGKDSITFNTDDLGPATDIDGNPLADTDEGNER